MIICDLCEKEKNPSYHLAVTHTGYDGRKTNELDVQLCRGCFVSVIANYRESVDKKKAEKDQIREEESKKQSVEEAKRVLARYEPKTEEVKDA